MWKVAHGYCPSIISSIFQRNLHNDKRFILPHPKNENDKLLLRYSSISAWNNFPDSLKQATLYSKFTNDSKELLLAKLV